MACPVCIHLAHGCPIQQIKVGVNNPLVSSCTKAQESTIKLHQCLSARCKSHHPFIKTSLQIFWA